MSIYYDANATTPVDSRVADLVHRYLVTEYGNAGSRTHSMGLEAKKAVNEARSQIAELTRRPESVILHRCDWGK